MKTLEEIITKLETTKFPERVWMSRNYSKKALIEDLKNVSLARQVVDSGCDPVVK